jgi:hypothetical protein
LSSRRPSPSRPTAIIGGGLFTFSKATVSGSTFTGNSAISGNGGHHNEPVGLLTQFDNRFLKDLPPDVFP